MGGNLTRMGRNLISHEDPRAGETLVYHGPEWHIASCGDDLVTDRFENRISLTPRRLAYTSSRLIANMSARLDAYKPSPRLAGMPFRFYAYQMRAVCPDRHAPGPELDSSGRLQTMRRSRHAYKEAKKGEVETSPKYSRPSRARDRSMVRTIAACVKGMCQEPLG